jgi:hypothetical protein
MDAGDVLGTGLSTRRIAIRALQMTFDDIVPDGDECLVWTLAALHARFLADAANPLATELRTIASTSTSEPATS